MILGKKMEYYQLIQKINLIVDNRIREKINLCELAKELGYTTFHINRIFSKFTGITIMAYVIRRKLQHALFDLRSGEKIIDIALKYGFETHSGFTKAFKKRFGIPPSYFQNNFNNVSYPE